MYNKLQVEWSGGPETAEETLGRIHQRGEAAVKRERAMAYAFSHQVSQSWECSVIVLFLMKHGYQTRHQK